ncbi:MAG TPA: PKD domain-containing protein, partial [Acidimicrobiia bacterium]|nr:PKD domain-containing protein [Acidimicrobiia bacterium]
VNVRLLDSTGVNGIPGATVEYNAGGWQSLGSTDPTGTITTELLGLNTQFRVTLNGQTQNKTQNTSTTPNVTYQTGRVLQGTGPRILAWFASGWHPFTNSAELLPGNVNFDFNTGPNKVYNVLAGAAIYVPVAPTAPVVTAADQSANEGQTVALSSVSFLDQETAQTHRAAIDWGDGSALATGMVVQANGLAGTVTGDHVFADEGNYNVEVCVGDDGNPDAEGCNNLQLTVANLDPSVAITGAPLSVVAEEDVTLGSVASDPGSADVLALAWTVSVDAVPVATGTGPDFSFTPGQPGWYMVTLVVNDGDGGTASAQVVLEVTAIQVPQPEPAPQPQPAPQPEPAPQPQPAPEPQPEPNLNPEQPAPEQPAVEIGETINNATSPTVSANAGPADPDQFETPEAGLQPAPEPGSETAVDSIEPTHRSDEVRLLALVAAPPSGSSESVISTSLLLGLIWLGPVLVILARTRLRRSQD